MSKPFHVGKAAQNGLLAALLAQQGFTSSERAIEAPRGFANVLATARNYAEITEGLGKTYEVSLNTYKPFACGIVIHPVIDGCVQLRNGHALRGDEIEKVELRVHPLVLELTGKRTPQVGLEGKFSVYHSAAVAIVDGTAREAQYSDARVADPAVIALRDRVRATVDPAIREEEAHVSISLKNGRTLTKHVRHAVGSVERPLSDEDLDAKFRDLASGVLSTAQVERVIELCRQVETLPDVAKLARAASADRVLAS
jgi:2-methylcitrate dehydratase PrpD